MLLGAEREFTDAHIDSRQCDLFRIHNNATLVRPACNPYTSSRATMNHRGRWHPVCHEQQTWYTPTTTRRRLGRVLESIIYRVVTLSTAIRSIDSRQTTCVIFDSALGSKFVLYVTLTLLVISTPSCTATCWKYSICFRSCFDPSVQQRVRLVYSSWRHSTYTTTAQHSA